MPLPKKRTVKLGEYLKRKTAYSSRSKIKALLRSRRVLVNGQVEQSISRNISSDFTVRVLPETHDISTIQHDSCSLPTILILNKPCDCVTTLSDELHRQTVADLVPKHLLEAGLHPVGRLDQHSTGLLILTTDGRLTRFLTDPKNHVAREYCCIVQGTINSFESLKQKLNEGVDTRWGKFHGHLIEAKNIKISDIDVEHLNKCSKIFSRQDGPDPFPLNVNLADVAMVKISVTKGTKRMVRRMLAYANYPVLSLFRYKFGGIEIDCSYFCRTGSPMPGKYRTLLDNEKVWLKSLYFPTSKMSSEAEPKYGGGSKGYDQVYTKATPGIYDKWSQDGYDEIVASNSIAVRNVVQLLFRAFATVTKSNSSPALSDRLLVLDAGCGTGRIAEVIRDELSSASENVVGRPTVGSVICDGVDFSEGMLEVARAKKLYRNLTRADLTSTLELEDSAYDAVVSSGVFLQGHVGPEAIPELARVLKPGGIMCFTVRPTFYEETKEKWQKGLETSGMRLTSVDMLPYGRHPAKEGEKEGAEFLAPMLTCIKES